MSSDFTLVDPKVWVYDLHSVYSAYIGYFQAQNVAWYDRSWGHLFSTFDSFLSFSWPVITVTDSWTGKPHIVTRLTSIGAFLKMIKTRFGETIPQAPNILEVTPFETNGRHLRHIHDYASYKRLYATLSAVVLTALKQRIRSGEPKTIRELWEKRNKTFLAIDFEWSERNEKTCLEWGYAAVRCGHLQDQELWPPCPNTNYRKGHYIIGEHVDKIANKHVPNHPWHYAFGESQVITKAKLPQIIEAVISGLASPDSEATPNTLVVVGHSINRDLARLEEMKIKLPHNVLILDTASYERQLHAAGLRGVIGDPLTGKTRMSGTTLSLEHMLLSLISSPPRPQPPASPIRGVPVPSPAMTTPPTIALPNVKLHNAGNDALMTLYALQVFLDPLETETPKVVAKGRLQRPLPGVNGHGYGFGHPGHAHGGMPFPTGPVVMIPPPSPLLPRMTGFGYPLSSSAPGPGMMPMSSSSTPNLLSVGGKEGRRHSAYDVADELGQLNVGNGVGGGGTTRSRSGPIVTTGKIGDSGAGGRGGGGSGGDASLGVKSLVRRSG